jgi:coenzyme F420-dependent glucose-6-phosphate dehydrogenase
VLKKFFNHPKEVLIVLELGYFAAHEQRDPNTLLEYAILAEKIGFNSVWSSDHFHPWSHTGASSGFAWSWMAAVAALTRKIIIGTGVTAPILRYHPAIVAQFISTMDYMFPGRIFLGLGTGEAMNEEPLGYRWPNYHERLKRLEEAVQIIRMLWTGEWTDFNGEYYKLKQARLYTSPKTNVPIYIAACGPNTAKIAGKYADGLLTLPMRKEIYINKIFPAMKEGASEAGRDAESLKLIIELEVSYDDDYDKAMSSCRYWAGTKLPNCISIPDPRELETLGQTVSNEKLRESWFVFTESEELIKLVEDYLKIGFNSFVFISSSPDEKKFLNIFEKKILPYLNEVKM